MEHQTPESALESGSQTLTLVPVLRVRQGSLGREQDVLAVEVPVALEYNGISHAVMLASPADLEDFALGFSLSEGIIANTSELYECETEATTEGWLLHIRIAADRFMALKEPGCGLCGTESLSQVTRCAMPVVHRYRFTDTHLLSGMRAKQALQPMQQQSGATHAAAWMNANGEIGFVREDVGRHNALDKLAGHLIRQVPQQGAVVLTSRVSIDMVQKVAALGAPVLIAVSAPTAHAVDLADEAGITLIALARSDRFEVFTHSDRLTESVDVR